MQIEPFAVAMKSATFIQSTRTASRAMQRAIDLAKTQARELGDDPDTFDDRAVDALREFQDFEHDAAALVGATTALRKAAENAPRPSRSTTASRRKAELIRDQKSPVPSSLSGH